MGAGHGGGWSGWFTDQNGHQVNEKVVERDSGGSQEHILRSTDGDREHHSHVVINRESTGEIKSAHGAPEKHKR